ncbi:RING/U-box [Polychytrium aggregatum]|uniref:RING/U-box n=1 Tax=Polychytrium aggregatum TaxID=110093 RepID=UPI0022FF2904|nr:RING/U-box [Polychytrium aggregatum]KAI9197225.1 RING/U-box [Polychytrium aggregatum]
MKITINSWNAHAYWKWVIGNADDEGEDDDEDICGICRFPYDACCPNCKNPGDDCSLLWGECSHVFHLHCITQWLVTRDHCPMDRSVWKTKT